MFLITVLIVPIRKFRYRPVGKMISFSVEFDVEPRDKKAGCSKTPFIDFKGETTRELFNGIVYHVDLNQRVFRDELDARDSAYKSLDARDTDEFDFELRAAETRLYRRLPLPPAGLALDRRISQLIWQNED